MPPLHSHQSSLESIIDFSAVTPLEPQQRSRAQQRFEALVNKLDAPPPTDRGKGYSRPRLIRYMYEYTLSDEAKDNFLRAFFNAIALPLDGDEELDYEDIRPVFFDFADHLLDNFFLPLKASTGKTPRPSPAHHSAVDRAQGGGTQDFVGTPGRLNALRKACLTRDRHRCVVSRKFDTAEATRRMKMDGEDAAKDDDGNRLLDDENAFSILEVAHILPHSLTQAGADSQLSPENKAALAILGMFDIDAKRLIEGTSIDQPRNAITLTRDVHQHFGDFNIFFEATGEPHTYRIGTFLHPRLIGDARLPIIRELFLTETSTIEAPTPRLLAVHRAVAHILHHSAAGEYIDEVLRGLRDNDVRADGSTDLGRMVGLTLGGWLGNSVSV